MTSGYRPSWNPHDYPDAIRFGRDGSDGGGGGDDEDGDEYYYSDHPYYYNSGDRTSNATHRRRPPGTPPPAPVPSREAMEGRWAFREACRRETSDHRRVLPGGESTISLARNVAHVLADREAHGSRHVTQRRLPVDQSYHCVGGAGSSGGGGIHGTSSREGGGGRSPLTVFESPVSTTTSPAAYDRDDSKPSSDALPMDRKRSAPVMEASKRRAKDADDNVCRTRERIRKVGYPMTISREVQCFGEHCSALKYQSTFLHHLGGDDELDEAGNRPPSSRAVSTISVAFSPDAQTMASTHGDHTVKITCCNSGLLLQSLEGHPRTPWTVKYHPTNSDVLASGCLGHQVRIWNWRERLCLRMVRLEFAIISLSFHPSGQVLAVANGSRLHFWGVDCAADGSTSSAAAGGANSSAITAGGERRGAALTEMDQRHMLRCVHFPPDGKSIIIGGVNPATDEARRRQRTGAGAGGMSFYLRLWDFDLDRALYPQSDVTASGTSIAQRPINNPRTFVPRALLYNDGGFDVSPDGLTLCACVEFWLPDGVDNAMELLHKEEGLFGADADEDDNETLPQDCDLSVDAPAPSAAGTRVAVAAALSRLRGMARDVHAVRGARSPSFRDGMDQPLSRPHTLPRTPSSFVPVVADSAGTTPAVDFIPRTPPNPSISERPGPLSPPSPPGRRFTGGLGQPREVVNPGNNAEPPTDTRGFSTPPPPPAPQAPQAPAPPNVRPPHPLSIVSRTGTFPDRKGRYVPHVVTISLDTDPIPDEIDSKLRRFGKPYGAVAGGYRPRLGQLLEACPLDASKASAVTCVKFSPSTDYCLIGYGVREPLMEGGGNFHPVTAIFRIRGGMTHVSTMLSGDDDVNIARFHPDSGHGFVYGTKQGRVRLLSPRPWNYYNC